MCVVYLGQVSQWHLYSQTDEIQSGEVGNKDIKKNRLDCQAALSRSEQGTSRGHSQPQLL